MELAGKHLLVLEDEYLIGLELERIAEECGAKSVHVVSTIDQLLDWIKSGQTCDLAILEVEARGVSSLKTASMLRSRNIPLLFTSAYDADLSGITEFAGTPVVGKPYGKSQIVQAVASLGSLTSSNRGSRMDDSSGELV
ncbi:response regulator [Phyllobacterium sp. YR531]|uniref:response regulator n=1 Tax=Phyllobacterium sp. YR531 TaxID=1144343 RepID=UPI00026F492F|nr:response regulator [Phyllobacterium sp. YR531]EJN05584.1 CheY-like receiver domain-containing protein [Phyllobacterium sp. YR531]